MTFQQNQNNKIKTLLKYAYVSIIDGDITYRNRGIVGENIEYPNIESLIVTSDSEITNLNIFYKYDKVKTKYEDNDLIINVLRFNISIPKSIEWLPNTNNFVITSPVKLFFQFKDDENHKTNFQSLLNYNEHDYTYYLRLALSNNEINQSPFDTNLYIYYDNKLTQEIYSCPVTIQVHTSMEPGGD